VPDGYIQQSPQAAVASAAIITPTGSLFHVTGSMAIETIKTPWQGFSGRITIIPDGAFTWTSTGNIAVSGTALVSKAITFTFDWSTRKWYPSY
jgi:hypothetical protein